MKLEKRSFSKEIILGTALWGWGINKSCSFKFEVGPKSIFDYLTSPAENLDFITKFALRTQIKLKILTVTMSHKNIEQNISKLTKFCDQTIFLLGQKPSKFNNLSL